ncbi:MAG: hypothetical protein A3B38_02870 [Candidatus Levybacteria bacterium RIFCSPLOWO2_01_FULL_36_13]|nr:MAG: hypothetical protein A2684_03960 [Candidatus Levybacteria bacterium RIFCSPHIGHO2_01_FULL_36_15b]OGH35835.1 MAG: hypothetical protein A3B38_02870 [Candidatus Levybacteria bacterium RIFCSPLOWO2_01_FULL_36_13]
MFTTNKVPLQIFAPILILILWMIADGLKIVNPVFLPSLKDVAINIINIFLLDGFYAVGFTLYRTFTSLIITSLIAIPVGLILGLNKNLYTSTELLIDFFRSVPATAFFPIFLLFLGIGDMAKIGISVFVCFWILLINTYYGVKNIPATRLKVAKVYKAEGYNLLRFVIFYDSLPQIVIGLRLSLSISLIITIVAEMFIGTRYGLGKIIYDSYAIYDTAQLFAAIFITGILGYILNKLFISTEKKFIHWIGK